MRYRVMLQGQTHPSFMIACNGVVIHATHKLAWCLGHTFEDIHPVLTTLNARWEVVSPRIDKPRHSHWIDYDGDASGAVIQD